MAKYKVKVEGKEYDVTVTESGVGARVTVEGATFDIEPAAGAAPAAPVAPSPVAAAPRAAPAAPTAAAPSSAPASGGAGTIVAPIPGMVTQVCVKVGEQVAANQLVLKLEAMKMENDISTPVAGTVKEVAVSDGSEVKDGQLLMVIE